MRVSRSPAFWVIFASMGIALAANTGRRQGILRENSTWAVERPSVESMSKDLALIREGTELNDVRGEFRFVGDRYVFVETGTNRTFKCLENLMLQRISAAIKDDARKANWVITAKVSEYSGDNYLLVDRAVRAR